MKFRFVKRTEPDGYVVYLTESRRQDGDIWLFVSGSLSSKYEVAEEFYRKVCERKVTDPVVEVLKESP